MINLLYYSHTVVPAHLEELETLGLLERDEQVLLAIDGVLLDASGKRLSGPTLHDYCLLTTLRVLLWARDYAGHICYAFPLTELGLVQGVGLDPIHAQISLSFVAPDEDEQRFTLALMPVASLQAAQTLLRCAAKTAQELAALGVDARAAGPEIISVIGEQIYGHVDGQRPGESPYRWPGASSQPLMPGPGFSQDTVGLPPERIYTAGRLARSAWDTLRRSLRETELPFDMNGMSLREITEAVRAVNELVQTVSTNPNAQQMAMAFLNRQRNGNGNGNSNGNSNSNGASESAAPAGYAESSSAAATQDAMYREIPLRRASSGASGPKADARPADAEVPPDRREIPLRRRGPANSSPRTFPRSSIPVSGSGDADVDDGR